jgi:mannose-6-phosphate isomerase-like protein (cupin superfamily)
MTNMSSKLLHFKGGNLPRGMVEYFAKEGIVPRTQFGTATVLSGQRLPGESFSLHDLQSEISYVIRGSCTFHADGEAVVLEEGDVLYNPRGTKHFVENLKEETCVVFWVLVEE